MGAWRATRTIAAAARAQVRAQIGAETPLWLHPGYVALRLHRLAHARRQGGRHRSARLLRALGLFFTGADLDPAASIGRGAVILNPQAVSIAGTLGENCTIMAQASVGWALGPERPGLPVIGDDVVLEPGALVLGPVRIGDGTRIGARCLVTSDVEGGTVVGPLGWRAARS